MKQSQLKREIFKTKSFSKAYLYILLVLMYKQSYEYEENVVHECSKTEKNGLISIKKTLSKMCMI